MLYTQIVQLGAVQLLRIHKDALLGGRADKRRVVSGNCLRVGDIVRLADRKELAVLLDRHHELGEKPGSYRIVVQVDRKGQFRILLLLNDILFLCDLIGITFQCKKVIVAVVAERQLVRPHRDVNLARLRVDQTAFYLCKILRVLLRESHFRRSVSDALQHILCRVYQRLRGVFSGVLLQRVLLVLGRAVFGKLYCLRVDHRLDSRILRRSLSQILHQPVGKAAAHDQQHSRTDARHLRGFPPVDRLFLLFRRLLNGIGLLNPDRALQRAALIDCHRLRGAYRFFYDLSPALLPADPCLLLLHLLLHALFSCLYAPLALCQLLFVDLPSSLFLFQFRTLILICFHHGLLLPLFF